MKENILCLYCDNEAIKGFNCCLTCDRRLRDRSRALHGLKPFTDAEYTQLRAELDGKTVRTVLVVNGADL